MKLSHPRTLSRIAAVACTAALMGGACATAQDAAPLRVYGNTTTIEIAPVLLTIEEGIYEAPATINMGGVPNLFSAQSGQFSDAGLADVATNAETQALRASVANPDLRILMTVSEGLYRIVAKRSSGISSIADLEGKRIASIANTSSNFFLERMLATAGLTTDDVEMVSTFPMDLYRTALTEDGFDAITVWEPGAEYAAQSIGDDAIEFHDPAVYREVFNLNTTAQALADPVMRARIVDFVAALVEATEQMKQDPSRAQELVAEYSGYPLDEVRRTWRHHAYPAYLVDDMLDVLEAEELWLARIDERPARSRAELATLIDSSVIDEVLARR